MSGERVVFAGKGLEEVREKVLRYAWAGVFDVDDEKPGLGTQSGGDVDGSPLGELDGIKEDA